MKKINSKHRRIAYEVAREYKSQPGILGIIWIGSSSFGIIDKYSDIDVRLLIEKDKKSFPMVQTHINGVKVEIEEMDWSWLLEDKAMDSERYWIRENAVILYDPNSLVKNSFVETNRDIKNEYKKQLWNIFKEVLSNYEISKSMNRNDYQTAALHLHRNIDALIRFLLLYYLRQVPPFKWRMHFLRSNKKIPQEILKNIDNMLSSAEVFENQLALLRTIQVDCKNLMLKKGYKENHIAEYWRY